MHRMQESSSFAVHPRHLWITFSSLIPKKHSATVPRWVVIYYHMWWYVWYMQELWCSDCTLPCSKAMDTMENCGVTFCFAVEILVETWYIFCSCEVTRSCCQEVQMEWSLCCEFHKVFVCQLYVLFFSGSLYPFVNVICKCSDYHTCIV